MSNQECSREKKSERSYIPQLFFFGPPVALAALFAALWSAQKIMEIGHVNFILWIGSAMFGTAVLINAGVTLLMFIVCLFRGNDEDAFWPFAHSAAGTIISYCFFAVASLAWNAKLTEEWMITYTTIIILCGMPFVSFKKDDGEELKRENDGE